MRKIIQITAMAGDGTDCVLALCDDGTVWYRQYPGAWRRLPDIPQHEGISEEEDGE